MLLICLGKPNLVPLYPRIDTCPYIIAFYILFNRVRISRPLHSVLAFLHPHIYLIYLAQNE